MWRNIQGIPRAFRGQFCGRTAGSVCKDEENKENEVSQVLNERGGFVRPFHSDRSFQRYIHHGGDKQDSQWSQDGDSHWHKSFNNNWGCLNQPHSTLEVVGWGTALLLGFQLSQLITLEGESCRKKYHRLKSNPDVVQRALGFHQQYGITSASCCIKDCPSEIESAGETNLNFKTEKDELSAGSDGSSFVDDTGSSLFELEKVLQYDFDCKLNDQQKPKKVSFEENQINPTATSEDPLPAATADWNQVLSLYESTVYNAKGLNSAKLGYHGDAIEFWEKACETGSSKANYNLGLCYEMGKGVGVNQSMAAKYYQKASSDGHSGATYNLAILYLMGKGGISKDVDKAIELLHEAADQGLAEAQRELGVMYTEKNDMKQAVSLFDKAAQQLDSAGQYYLGICYENGFGVAENTCKAAQLYASASRTGHPEATYNLAVFYEKGLGGLPEDLNESLSLYKLSVNSGNVGAEEDVERLQRLLSRNESGEYDNVVLSGLGRNIKVGGSASSPSLIGYLEKHLAEFGLGEWDVKHARSMHKPTPHTQQKNNFYENDNSRAVEFILGSESDDIDFNVKNNVDHKVLVNGGYGDAGSGHFSYSLSLLPGAGRMNRSTSAFELKTH